MTETVAFVLYPGLTPLDVIGPLQVVSTLANIDPRFAAVTVATDREPMAGDAPVWLAATHTFDEMPEPYGLIVPGGTASTFAALTDETLLGYVRRSARTATFVGSVCTGSLVLGAAGLLAGRRATTHWAALSMLAAFGAVPERRRWVRDGELLTAAGVSAGVDMALHLVEELAGKELAHLVQLGIEYDPEPPLGPIDWPAANGAPIEAWLAEEARIGLRDHPELLERLLGPTA